MKNAFALLLKRPAFIVPILFCWVLVSSIILYLRYCWVSPEDPFLSLLEILFSLFLITYIICIANMVMLELLQSSGNEKEVSLVRAIRETIFNDAIKAIPIAILWAILWFILLLIQVLTSKRNNSSRAEPSLQDAAMTLGGANSGPITWTRLGLEMLEKLLRLVSFLALPGIAWKNNGPIQSLKESIEVIRKNPIQFFSAYTLTSLAAGIMSLPLIPLYVAVKEHIHISNFVWTVVIIYEGITWSLSIYLEQMTLGLLYLKYEMPTSMSTSDEVINDFSSKILLDVSDEEKSLLSEKSQEDKKVTDAKISSLFTSVTKWIILGSVASLVVILVLTFLLAYTR